MVTKDRLIALVEQLPESEHPAAFRFLSRLQDSSDPVLSALLDAPEDDEEEDDEEKAAVAEARDHIENGRVITRNDLIRELGI